MKFTETYLKGAFVIELNPIRDERGFFARSWCKREMEEHGLNTNIVQANVSFTEKKGTLRGIHYQIDPYQETKLFRCTGGALFDVIVDLRKESPTYLKWFGVELTAENNKMVYVPENFGHAYLILQDGTTASYMVTQFYTPGAEAGIRWNDPAIKIDWPLSPTIISEKDQNFPDLDISHKL